MVCFYLKQIFNELVCIRVIVRIFSFGERLLAPSIECLKNILIIALITFQYLYYLYEMFHAKYTK